MKKLVLSIITITVLLFGLNMLSASAADIIASGDYGALTYTLDSDGLLTISGTGWGGYPAPWEDFAQLVKTVKIGSGANGISGSAFDGCTNLVSISVDAGNKNLSSDSIGVLFNKNKTELYCFPKASECANYTIPDSVTKIDYRAFENCTSLTSITIPDSVTTIDSYAFSGCGNLNKVNITDISAWCKIKFFSYSYSNPLCYGADLYLNGKLVTDLVIPEGVFTINAYAFYNCDSLTSVTIGDSVLSIGDFAFSSCTSLTSVTIGDNVTTIGSYAFGDCDSLASVTIPDSVTTIGACAFEDCDSLASVTIPDSVTTIGDWAFSSCTSLTSVTIPDSVTTIGNSAFYWCNRLSKVEYAGSAVDWAEIDIGSDNTRLTSATINYNSPLFHKNAITNTISITKTDKTTDWSFAIKLDRQTLDTDYAYVGIYSANGKMLGMDKAVIGSDGRANIDITKVDGASYAKVFAWYNYQPIAPDERIDL